MESQNKNDTILSGTTRQRYSTTITLSRRSNIFQRAPKNQKMLKTSYLDITLRKLYRFWIFFDWLNSENFTHYVLEFHLFWKRWNSLSTVLWKSKFQQNSIVCMQKNNRLFSILDVSRYRYLKISNSSKINKIPGHDLESFQAYTNQIIFEID